MAITFPRLNPGSPQSTKGSRPCLRRSAQAAATTDILLVARSRQHHYSAPPSVTRFTVRARCFNSRKIWRKGGAVIGDADADTKTLSRRRGWRGGAEDLPWRVRRLVRENRGSSLVLSRALTTPKICELL